MTNLLFVCLSVCFLVGTDRNHSLSCSVEFGLEKGIIININSYEELEVMTDIMKELRQV